MRPSFIQLSGIMLLALAFQLYPAIGQPLFSILKPEQSGIVFQNHIIETVENNITQNQYFYNGAGVGIGDFDNDGLQDIVFTGNLTGLALYRNLGKLKFEDVTAASGLPFTHTPSNDRWFTGVVVADVNADGFADIYISRCQDGQKKNSENLLFINNGNLTFTEQASTYGIADPGNSMQSVFFDYDSDGYLDLFVMNRPLTVRYSDLGKKSGDDTYAQSRLYKNNRNNTFTDVTSATGILKQHSFGLGISVSDINSDGFPDLLVVNDLFEPDFLYINTGKGTFEEKSAEYFSSMSLNSMGCDVADFNNDGLPDIGVVDMLPEDNFRLKTTIPEFSIDYTRRVAGENHLYQYVRNSLQLNRGKGVFKEIGQLAGIEKTDWSWTFLFADLDNDGWKDIFITNGLLRDFLDLDFSRRMRDKAQTNNMSQNALFEMLPDAPSAKLANYVYGNNGDLTFSDMRSKWGFEEGMCSSGGALADLDNDGDLDMVVNNMNAPSVIIQNLAEKNTTNKYLRFALKGENGNKAGYGAKVTIYAKGKMQFAELLNPKGYLSSSEPFIHFGVGNATTVDSAIVHWQSGKKETLKNVKTNRVVVLEESKAERINSASKTVEKPLFSPVDGGALTTWKHAESPYSDFSAERLLPRQFSMAGPGAAAADLNGDGLDDFVIGGATRQEAGIFLQKTDGSFSATPFSDQQALSENTAVLLFDADNDGDIDLFLSNGSNEIQPPNSVAYQDLLFLNDGKANFSLAREVLPELRFNSSCAVAADYDGDGWVDLFIGGGVTPGSFPKSSGSRLLRNEKGKFKDITAELAPALLKTGLVNAAIWTDFDNDGQLDLIVASDWAPLRFFRNDKGKLTDDTDKSGTHQYFGWWNSIVSGDFNNDGLTDYIAGNLGLNTMFDTDTAHPVTMYASDIDENGSIDPILFYYLMEKNVPLLSRDAITEQLPMMAKRFTTFKDYGNAGLNELFKPAELAKAETFKSNCFETCIFINRGKGKFEIKKLPSDAQIIQACGMITEDLDADGNEDILITGNVFSTFSDPGRFGTGACILLKGDGKGNFKTETTEVSGLICNRSTRALVPFASASGAYSILVSNNNASPQIFSLNKPLQSKLLKQGDISSEIVQADGRKRKKEFGFGSGYLSQGSRRVWTHSKVKSITVRNAKSE